MSASYYILSIFFMNNRNSSIFESNIIHNKYAKFMEWLKIFGSNNSTKTIWNFLDGYIDTETIYRNLDNTSPGWDESIILIGQITLTCSLVLSACILILQYLNLSNINLMKDDVEYNSNISVKENIDDSGSDNYYDTTKDYLD